MTTLNPQNDLEISSDILDHLTDLGLQGEELHKTARAWLCTEAEISMWASRGNQTALQTDQDKTTREISKLATQMERAIINHGRVLTPALAAAGAEKLLTAIDYYEAQLDELWPTYRDATGEERTAALEKWERLNGYLWEAKTAADVPTVSFQVLTGESLTDRLRATLKTNA